jgi:AcrR family transcriptional regulator
MPLHASLGEWGAAKAILELLWERLPGWHPYTRILAFLTAMQGDLERARKLMAESFPWMLEDGLELAASDLNSAIVFAAILNATGEIQQRDELLSALEEQIATLHRTRGIGYGILDVYIHAIRGDRDRAIAALRDAIEIGWRISWSHLDSSWWLLQDDWRLADLQQDPEFIAMVNELEADIDAQRQWFEENKDKPLF